MALTTKNELAPEALAHDVSALVAYARERGLIHALDERWAYNAILEAVGAKGPAPVPSAELAEQEASESFDLEAVIGRIAEVAVANGVDEDTPSGRDRAATRVMGILTPRPSEVAVRFDELMRDGAEDATDWFYRMCCDARYVREAAIARNIKWSHPCAWGDLEITINLSKPEKDPKAIAAAGAAPAGEAFPACQLCMENEGYPGRGAGEAGGAHPARQNLRIVPITLGEEPWGLQYSPYAYFDEHCIAMSETHRPMHVDRENLSRLLDFVDLFPHYFIGSNADLPIVGGSILSHDHFQGGRHEFPMMRAEVASTFVMPGHESVSGAVLRWPMSVLRLSCPDRDDLLSAAVHVLDAWRAWSDEEAGVVAESDGERHNTVSPICRRHGSKYELYLALRCNVTSEEFPLGVFHPHAQWHHIKKENIGLIEVMGLAILPPRLKEELARVEARLAAGELDQLDDDPLCASHAAWAREVAAAHPELDADNVCEIVRDEVGAVFGHVLEDAGVFKWDDAGRAAQARFVASL